ncbi:hypothetical protein GCM10010250_44950 [Streptomyces althioticus]|nr:hypothetical protein GCM10010250_44950 [Streptomyces althioticus]
MVAEEQADGLGGEQRRVAQRPVRLDDTVFVRPCAGPVLEQSQLHAGSLTGPWSRPCEPFGNGVRG